MLRVLLPLALVLAAAPALASDIPDPDGCAARPAGVTGNLNVDTVDTDRGYLCVSDGQAANGSELYVGGELVRDNPSDPGKGTPCGAIAVGGMTLSGDNDWDNAGYHCD